MEGLTRLNTKQQANAKQYLMQNAAEALSNLIASNGSFNQSDPLIGAVIDRYEILELIDTGAWGNVYKARNLMLGIDVAIKIVHKHVLKDESTIKRFRREARLLNKLDSPNVIKVLDADVTPFPYIVMEYFDGVPLNKWLKMHGPMNAQMALDLFCQLCKGLSHAEALNIVHRDLKPANILIKTYGNSVEAKILDFGMAKCFSPENTTITKITSTGDILGSPAYMAPEQFKGQCDSRSDLYSVACIMYEMLAGVPAFTACNSIEYLKKHLFSVPLRISKHNPSEKIPAGLENVIFRCLEKSPKKRFQSANACREHLKSIRSKFKPHYLHAGENRWLNSLLHAFGLA